MKKMMIYTILAAAILCCPASGALAEMQSNNYLITTSVLAGGGMPMTSASYGVNATLGQPSPLIGSSGPPGSLSYALYSGFWYTTEVASAGAKTKYMPWLPLLLED